MANTHSAGLKAKTQTTADERRWKSVLARETRADGEFVYAVSSTGIYCKPSCGTLLSRDKEILAAKRWLNWDLHW